MFLGLRPREELSPEEEAGAEDTPPFDLVSSSKLIPNLEYPSYTADRVVALPNFIAVMDGVSSGGTQSVEAAGIAQECVLKMVKSLDGTPSAEEAKRLLTNALLEAQRRIKELQTHGTNSDADTTFSGVLGCRLPDGKQGVVVANVGDSRVYKCGRNGEIKQVTRDHSLINALVAARGVSPEEALTDERKHIIYRTLRSLRKKEDIDFFVLPVEPGDFFIASTDGFHGSLTQRGVAFAIKKEADKLAMTLGRIDPRSLATILAQRALNIQLQRVMAQRRGAPDDGRVNPDDISVAVLCVLPHPKSTPV